MEWLLIKKKYGTACLLFGHQTLSWRWRILLFLFFIFKQNYQIRMYVKPFRARPRVVASHSDFLGYMCAYRIMDPRGVSKPNNLAYFAIGILNLWGRLRLEKGWKVRNKTRKLNSYLSSSLFNCVCAEFTEMLIRYRSYLGILSVTILHLQSIKKSHMCIIHACLS